MKTSIKIVALLLAITCFGLVGCDQMRESFLGQPDPNATTLTPVGPTGDANTQNRMVAMESGAATMDALSNAPAPSPFVIPANAHELAGQSVPAVVQSGGPNAGPGMFASAQNEGNGSNGVQVPAAENFSPSSDGKIFINRRI